MSYQIKIEQFQGPLDLLLQLIENQKLDISQISLAAVTDQYLNYLEQIENNNAAELADFLLIATKLLVIKSKILLPQTADEEEDSAEELEAQLKLYKDYFEATKVLTQIIGQNHFCFSREKIAFQFTPTFSPPSALTGQILADFYRQILNRVDYVVNLPQKVMKRAISLKQVVLNIRSALAKAKKMNFQQFLAGSESRDEVVAHFMALLELIKSGEVAVKQRGVFDEIMVEKI